MKKMFKIRFLLILLVLVPWGCEDELEYLQNEPEWLGPSIYEYLEKDGRFTNYMALLNQTEYKDILSRTGSRTLFVPDDSAFQAFYQKNKMGIKSVTDFSPAMVQSLVKSFMLSNAIVSPLLTYPKNKGDIAFRRPTAAFTANDSISTMAPLDPEYAIGWDGFGNAEYKFGHNIGGFLPYFLQRTQDFLSWTDEDMSVILQGPWQKDDFYVLQTRVKQRDITCKNGYINVLSEVTMPPTDLYHWIKSQPNLSIFGRLLDRFSIPVYSPEATQYNTLMTGAQDSIYRMTVPGVCNLIDLQLTEIHKGEIGYWGEYYLRNGVTLFVPDDATLTEYFNTSFLAGFGSWDDVPKDIISQLINAHFRATIDKSVPSCFSGMKAADTYGTFIAVESQNVVDCGVCTNGLAYVINKVCAPDVLESVVAPVLSMDNANLMNAIIYKIGGFSQLFSSTDYAEGFTVLITPDEYMKGWVDPISYASTASLKRVSHEFYWDKDWKVEFPIRDTCRWMDTGEKSGFNPSYNNGNKNHPDTKAMCDKLTYIGNSQLLIGDINNGDRFFHTLNNEVLEVRKSGGSMQVLGAGNMTPLNVLSAENKRNGMTYVIDGLVQSPITSPYSVLLTEPSFKTFYDLLLGAADKNKGTGFNFFAVPSGFQCVDYNSSLFTGKKYTLFVPTNEALQAAHEQGIYKTWDEIALLGSLEEQKLEKERLMRYLKTYFMDDCVYIGNHTSEKAYLTAALNEEGRSIQLKIATDDQKITLTDPKGNRQEIREDGNKTNILTSEYTFDGNDYRNKLIKSSCAIVIHKLDKALVIE